ncbi:TIGR02234 family membrane protein [Streptomyces longwoodensis]|uniref:TIGR02234 family membrane protein n=1 Tax=Streptomyces longwoodensis TaxID=68231 RepID=UPI002259F476|nr:TIGR02234 family membrane protein [Streptomyces longwoodensis]MCX4998837.1 TIGR02234 family membrane protein [Streptomyces longwoodensis]WRY92922.1 TIGR02234 family membrane protein [Streptomyces longwoodensis]WTI49727.1 TIGR02234 family membrane protein [Streptomyces longwoodensis]WUC62616.1 TIGR02234 family membrane protein [Streptomyces longwoodensis]WUC75997.1 TIGR02234 family membrane protein [Streptomyces longwoodensis]
MEYVTAVPHPRTEAAGPARAGRRSLAVALLSGALGAAVALLATRQRWSEGTATVAGGSFPLTARGSDVTGVPAALAIVGLAALVAVFAVRRAGRLAVSALLALSGLGIVTAALVGASDSGALDEKAAQASGDTSATVASFSHTAWPYVAAVGGLLILLAGLLALRYGRLWPAMSGRYERDGAPRPRRAAAPVDPDRPEDIWKALDRGEDPTRADPA